MITKEDISAHFKKKPRPQSFRELAYALGLGSAEQRQLKRLLRELLHTGDLVQTRKGLYAPSEEVNLVKGYFEAHREGYGFVIPDNPGERDVFIPPPFSMGAMDNDRVIARPEPPGRKGRIIRILERARRKVAGTVQKTKTSCFVKPKSKAIGFDIYIPHEFCADVKNGQSVVVEIVEFPPDKRPPEGRIVKVIEKPESPLDEIEAVIEEFGLPRRFPHEVTGSAKSLRLKKEAAKRKDLRALPTVTIDGERAKDFDDAVSIEVTELGYRLWVHIADVSAYVPWDSPIDVEARKRGTSYYFPDRVIPMLPRELSENLCSLLPDEDRLAFTAEMEFDRYGKRFGQKFYPSLIKSNERMTYTQVARILTGEDQALTERYQGLIKDFENMVELASALRGRRMARGSLDFDLPEPEVLLDIQGRPEAIVRAERNIAHILIEEFMVAANEAVAEHLSELDLPSVYRVHEGPDPDKLEDIYRIAKTLFRKSFPKQPTLSAILALAKDTPKEEIVNQIILRSMKQARYSTVNAGHFGLASACYTHFTSPIRRYPDLIVHRILKEALPKKRISDEKKGWLEENLPDMAFSSSRMERTADESERVVLRAMRAWFMRDKTGDEFEARIVGITSYGIRARLTDFFVEGFLHVSAMTDDFYVFNEKDFSLAGRHTGKKFRIGDVIRVRVDRVDMEEKEIVLGIQAG